MLKALSFPGVEGIFVTRFAELIYNFGKIQNVGGTELSEEKKLVFHWRKISYSAF